MKIRELAYVRMQVPDLDLAERFFHTFGLLTRVRAGGRLYMRACGPEHHVLVLQQGGDRRLLGVAFEVASEEQLRRAAEIDGASGIGELDDPGGGLRVLLRDPDGTPIELVHGISKTAPVLVEGQELNVAIARNRRLNTVVRPERHPSKVLRLGHIVLRSPDVARAAAWYRDMLGLLESDDVPDDGEDGEDRLAMSFMRLDHGPDYVDHHVLQLLKGPPAHVHHISFEVQGIDDLHIGHEVLRDAGYQHVWGIGRHLQGSQIFDYWLDPFGVMYEHWTDTDLLNAATPKGRVRRSEMHGTWGGEPPATFRTHATS